MKPAFALDFRNDAITLLHRAAGGWHQVGRVALDEPDLPAALSYLRATALGLSPRGLSTKLVLPDDQLLITTVEAPGPDEATRLAQIRAALEGRTPYAVDDLLFDWEEVGGEVRVAVVARETLAEAEAFATEHRFNPVAFVAAPAAGFVAEPWFGLTAQAQSLLAPGETVEPDRVQVQVTARAIAPEPEAAEPEQEIPAEPVIAPEADPMFEPVADPERVEPDAAEIRDEDLAEEAAADHLDAQDDPVVEGTPSWNEFVRPDPADVAMTAMPVATPHLPDEDVAAPVVPPRPVTQDAAPTYTAPPLRAEPRAEPRPPKVKVPRYDMTGLLKPAPRVEDRIDPVPPAPRDMPIFGLADDEPPPSAAFRTGAAAADPAPRLPADAIEDLPEDIADALKGIDLQQEAPMAVDVEDDTGAARRSVTDPSVLDDVPPMPGYSPAMGFASRRASVDGGLAGRAPEAPPRPSVPRPTAAKPLGIQPAPKAERPAINRPTAVAPVVPKESKGGLRGLGALVTAPGIPGTRKKKVAANPAPARAAAPQVAAETEAAVTQPESSLGRGLGRRQVPVRGKPRYLGLILTVLLLLVLAVIAAWSTSLAFRSSDGTETELAAPLPAPEDEMIADGVEPETVAAPQAEVAAEAPALDSTVANAQAEPEATEPAMPNLGADDIQLAARDQAPAAPAPLALPEVSAQGDPLPTAQAPPPPFGTVYQFSANGLIVPTPEGIITPEGVRLVAGKPPVVPKPRPEGLSPVAPAADDPAQPAVTPETTGALDPAATLAADPALAGFRPKARPEGLVAPLEVNENEATPAIVNDSRLAGKRPMARPEAVLLAGEAARAATAAAAASLAAQAEQASAATNSPMAIAISRRPAPRPQDLSRAVEAAVAAAVRAPEPQPEAEAPPEQEQLASASPQPKPEEPEAQPEEKAASSLPRGRDGDIEAEEEPEVEAAAPSGKQSGSVAKQATFKNALALDKTALIGVYGTPSKRYAMIRTSGGRYKKVKVGDSIDGGKIQAITASEVRYKKGSRLMTLSLPKS